MMMMMRTFRMFLCDFTLYFLEETLHKLLYMQFNDTLNGV